MSQKDGELEFIKVERSINRPQRTANLRKVNRRRKKKHFPFLKSCLVIVGLVLVYCLIVNNFQNLMERVSEIAQGNSRDSLSKSQEYPQELRELWEKNEEARDFVEDYPNREAYQNQSIDLTAECSSRVVPLLMQWDKRWGYDAYGDSMVALAGCGPTCLSMAYLYFTRDADMNPAKMAEFAYDNGYYTEEGTSWSLWTEGVEQLGLHGENMPLSEEIMKNALDNGKLVVCSMSPGDFTTTGHFILICGYDENGFYVNDPNRRRNSEKQWDYDTLSSQIKNLWGISLAYNG